MTDTAPAPAPAPASGAEQVLPVPDPSVLTTQQLSREVQGIEREIGMRQDAQERELALRQDIREREHRTLQELLEVSINNNTALITEKLDGVRREIDIHEAYRLELKEDAERHRQELKADGEKALSTALTAAEKAVQAALAAAEKARDQQTIASQLATTKAEDAAKEQLKTQGEKFSADIAALVTSVNDVKGLMGEMRAEKRGGQEIVVEKRAVGSQWLGYAGLALAVLTSGVIAIVIKVFGG